jgi:hypothetical protein
MAGGMFFGRSVRMPLAGEPYRGTCFASFSERQENIPSVSKTGIDSQRQPEDSRIDANTSRGFGHDTLSPLSGKVN